MQPGQNFVTRTPRYTTQPTVSRPQYQFSSIDHTAPPQVNPAVFNQGVSSHIHIKTQTGGGSGVIVKTNRSHTYVVTNRHVVNEGVAYITDGTNFWNGAKLHIHARSAVEDIAIIRVDRGNAPWVSPIKKTSKITPTLVCVGGPYGSPPRYRTTSYKKRYKFQRAGPTIAMTSPMAPGESGGGVYNTRGELVGIIWGSSAQGPPEGMAVDLTSTQALINWKE